MGHGLGGHTETSHVKIPDYRIYEVSKLKTPKLYEYQERLAREGLKDPFIRNFVWRYDRKYKYSWWTRSSCIVVGTALGFACAGVLIWFDRNRKCPWHKTHHEIENTYKLLYQLKDDYVPQHPADGHH